MKFARIVLGIFVAGILLLTTVAVAQDADKEKLIAIEKEFANNPSSGEPAAEVAKPEKIIAAIVQQFMASDSTFTRHKREQAKTTG